MSERIYDARHDFDPDHVLHVEADGPGRLILSVVQGDAVAAIEFDTVGAKKLRLALQRYERSRR